MEACSLLVNLRKGMQSSSEQPLVGEEHCVTTLITAAKETTLLPTQIKHAPAEYLSMTLIYRNLVALTFIPNGTNFGSVLH